MTYAIKAPILGLENIQDIELTQIDEMFVTIQDKANPDLSITLTNPYSLREYSFAIPTAIKTLLDITEDSRLLVYNVTIIQDPLDKSCVNFLAPIIFNEDNKTAGQVVLRSSDYPDFGIEPIRDFIKE